MAALPGQLSRFNAAEPCKYPLLKFVAQPFLPTADIKSFPHTGRSL
jgi:hypothetical protein